MSKQPKYPYSYSKLGLPEDFPFSVSQPFEQSDKKIDHLHFHNAAELGVCHEGSGIFVVEGKILPFKGGDISFIGREERHLAQSLAGTVSKWHWISFDPERLLCPAFMDAAFADLSKFKGPGFRNVMTADAHPKICSLAKALLEAWSGSPSFKRQRAVALLTLFAAEMHEAFPEAAREPAAGPGISAEPDSLSRLGKALEHLARNSKRGVDFAKLPALCGMSATHFRRLFKSALGKPPRQYFNQMRLSMAMAELAASRRAVSEIAASCGFETLSSFNRQFKAELGMSPREWRGRQGPLRQGLSRKRSFPWRHAPEDRAASD